MPLDILKLLNVVVFGTNAQVCLPINKNFERIKRRHENPLPDVKLLVINQKRSFYVFLENFGTHLFLVLIAIERIFQRVETKDTDTTSVVARLADPDVARAVDRSVLGPLLFQ